MGMKLTEIKIEAQIGVARARMERWQIVHVGSMESGHCGAFSDRAASAHSTIPTRVWWLAVGCSCRRRALRPSHSLSTECRSKWARTSYLGCASCVRCRARHYELVLDIWWRLEVRTYIDTARAPGVGRSPLSFGYSYVFLLRIHLAG